MQFAKRVATGCLIFILLACATTAGVVTGLLTGTATAFFFWLNPELKPLDMHEGIIGLLVHVPVLVAVSLATRAQDEAHVERFLG